jgi:hypothetical protein
MPDKNCCLTSVLFSRCSKWLSLTASLAHQSGEAKLTSKQPLSEERETDWVKGSYVWDVVAVSVQVNEDAPVRFRLLNPFLRRSGQEASEAPVSVNFPKQHPHSLFHARFAR